MIEVSELTLHALAVTWDPGHYPFQHRCPAVLPLLKIVRFQGITGAKGQVLRVGEEHHRLFVYEQLLYQQLTHEWRQPILVDDGLCVPVREAMRVACRTPALSSLFRCTALWVVAVVAAAFAVRVKHKLDVVRGMLAFHNLICALPFFSMGLVVRAFNLRAPFACLSASIFLRQLYIVILELPDPGGIGF